MLIWKEDRVCQRLLFMDMDRQVDPDIYEMRVMIFGSLRSSSIAQFEEILNANRFEKEIPSNHTHNVRPT